MTAVLAADAAFGPAFPRVKRQSSGIYNGAGGYVGKQRGPIYEEEYGAYCVIELVFGGLLAIRAIPGDRLWMRVASLPVRPR